MQNQGFVLVQAAEVKLFSQSKANRQSQIQRTTA